MNEWAPLDFDFVALAGVDGLDARWDCGAANVADEVVAGKILDRAVVGWHADADLFSRGYIVDPELLEVLMGRDGSEKSTDEDGVEEHVE